MLQRVAGLLAYASPALAAQRPPARGAKDGCPSDTPSCHAMAAAAAPHRPPLPLPQQAQYPQQPQQQVGLRVRGPDGSIVCMVLPPGASLASATPVVLGGAGSPATMVAGASAANAAGGAGAFVAGGALAFAGAREASGSSYAEEEEDSYAGAEEDPGSEPQIVARLGRSRRFGGSDGAENPSAAGARPTTGALPYAHAAVPPPAHFQPAALYVAALPGGGGAGSGGAAADGQADMKKARIVADL
jgi:hypothetical protein